MLEKWCRHLVLLDSLDWGDEKLPKHHLMIHLTANMAFSGNAWDHACFLDESLNKLLKVACKNASTSNFEGLVFLKLTELLERDARKRKSMA